MIHIGDKETVALNVHSNFRRVREWGFWSMLFLQNEVKWLFVNLALCFESW